MNEHRACYLNYALGWSFTMPGRAVLTFLHEG